MGDSGDHRAVALDGGRREAPMSLHIGVAAVQDDHLDKVEKWLGLFGCGFGAGPIEVMLANLIPVLSAWWSLPTGLAMEPPAIPEALRRGLLLMAAGVFLSGMRDLYAALELPHGNWPWGAPVSSKTKGN